MARTYDPKKYNALLLYLQEFFAAHDWAPTFDEILAGAGLSSKCLIRPTSTGCARTAWCSSSQTSAAPCA